MTGWRYWRVQDGKLVSPFAGEPMPLDGLVVASTPLPFRNNGVHYHLTPADAYTTAQHLPPPVAITAGIIHGSHLPEHHMQPYRDGDTWVTVPPGRRCTKYEVTQIYTDAAITVDYGIPTHPLSEVPA